MPPTQPTQDVLSMILVMGVTGAGKSYFINKLADENVAKTGGDLKSCKSIPSQCDNSHKTLIESQVLPNVKQYL